MRNKVIFYLNGIKKEVGAKEASMMLADYLRYDQCLTGTKIVCAEGDCGACSVLRLFPHLHGVDSKNYVPINSCISLVAQLDGSSLVTVDALKENDGKLHETQRAMVECHGSQCGFCTPGFVIALTGLVEEKLSKNEKTIEVQEAKNGLTGNLCRCTGYRSIIDAATSIDLDQCKTIKERFYSERQEVDLTRVYSESLLIESEEFFYYAPKTLKEALVFLKDYPDCRIIGSGTDLGVVHNKRRTKLNQLMSLHLISSLYQVERNEDVVTFGARVSHAEFRHFLKDKVPEFSRYLDVFASPQIKNTGTVVGNIATASPIGDTPPVLLALDATIIVESTKGIREIPIDQFFLAYRKTAIQHGELITKIKFKVPDQKSHLRFFKYSNRKDLDISAINLAMKLRWKDDSKKEIEEVILAAGGLAPTPIRFLRTEELLKKGPDLEAAVKVLHSEVKPISDLRASSPYRHVLLENYFRKFFSEATV